MELLMGFLRNPKCRLRLVIKLLEDYILPQSAFGVAQKTHEQFLPESRAAETVDLRSLSELRQRGLPHAVPARHRATQGTVAGGGGVVTQSVSPNASISVMTIEPRGNGRSGKFCYNYKSTIGDLNATHDNDHLYRFPYESGKSYGVLQGYGSRFSHTGREQYSVDFNMPEGTPVLAAGSKPRCRAHAPLPSRWRRCPPSRWRAGVNSAIARNPTPAR